MFEVILCEAEAKTHEAETKAKASRLNTTAKTVSIVYRFFVNFQGHFTIR